MKTTHSLYRGNIQTAFVVVEYLKANPDMINPSTPPLQSKNVSVAVRNSEEFD
ncbi:hypothetical protein SAMD00019534_095670 [Acytostelium subglobosum LB1]|uniref:hypothetical protein n=1 Tax=Acytostelium subglobosum LB1 TaxID=1410327 RepID=UPI000644BE38|nr:hypothetical protein SAMD00019534_095670 [Acytostelium subglobosum LB1]GAM26392.1 hypothetical protein SAMD00019534_095670 [Acytostelium subglobosum LB1]|eukprot:XP_012750488.1 hypothetical protein SAMD00019534_095670 [Acytostelium subglobosum LB1]